MGYLLRILTAPNIAPWQKEKYNKSPSKSRYKHFERIQRLYYPCNFDISKNYSLKILHLAWRRPNIEEPHTNNSKVVLYFYHTVLCVTWTGIISLYDVFTRIFDVRSCMAINNKHDLRVLFIPPF
jgi:hypothetical protein